MTLPAPLPSLFGRFTSILQEHDHLGKTLRRLRSMCTALESGQAEFSPEVSPELLLAELREHLSEHFRAEESAEYFGVVIDEAPTLGPRIAGLKWEHLMMLKAADALDALAKDSSSWAKLAEPTRALVTQLELHERAESLLLRELFFPKR